MATGGLLDWVQSPAGIGLLSAVAGGMAGAQRGTPWNNAGRAGIAGLTGYGTAKDQLQKEGDNALTKQLKQLQMAEIAQKLADNQAKLEWKTGLPNVMAPKLTGTTDQGIQLADQQSAFGAEGVPDLVESAQYAQPDAPLGMNFGTDKKALQDYARLPGSPVADDLIKQQFVPGKQQLVTVQTPSGPMQKWVSPGETTGVDVGAPIDKEGALPWYVKKGENGLSIDPAYAEFERTKAANLRPPAQPMAPVAYVDDRGQTVWGTITEARGRPAANYDPAIQGRLASSKKEGAEIGEQRSMIVGKENAVESIKKARTYLNDGIYSGAWGPLMKDTIKRIPGTDKSRAVRTEAFLSEIGNVVIPRLKEFGGNDSNEELRYLQRIMGGDIQMEPEALSSVLNSAEIKIQRGIDRLNQDGRSRLSPQSTPKPAKGRTVAPQQAINDLRKNPSLAAQFKAKYGYLP